MVNVAFGHEVVRELVIGGKGAIHGVVRIDQRNQRRPRTRHGAKVHARQPTQTATLLVRNATVARAGISCIYSLVGFPKRSVVGERQGTEFRTHGIAERGCGIGEGKGWKAGYAGL